MISRLDAKRVFILLSHEMSFKMYGRTGKGNSNTNILKFLFSKIVVYGLETGPFS